MGNVKSQAVYPSILPTEIRTEFVRKTIHLLIALIPPIASFSTALAMGLLGVGILTYTVSEKLRRDGHQVFVISRLTVIASRTRDSGFVMGPVTLGLGAMLALLLYPAPAAAIAIYALAFGDSAASLVGKTLGRVRMPFTEGKTLAGTAACFTAVLLVSYGITGRLGPSCILAASAALFEALPAGDLDNLVLPVGTGFVASRLLLIA